MSCVEDGVSHAETRIHMDCGGSDTSAIFYDQLRHIGFPYEECDPAENPLDAALIHKLKEDYCHLDLDTCGVLKKSFEVSPAIGGQGGGECSIGLLGSNISSKPSRDVLRIGHMCRVAMLEEYIGLGTVSLLDFLQNA